MAILNEYAIMGPNYPMLVLGIVLVCTGVSMCFSLFGNAKKFGSILFGLVVVLLFIFGGSYCTRNWDNQEFQIPTGKKYIEATFANGEIPAVYLKKYNVIDVDDNVYLLEEKDGVKEDNRPIVRLGEVK